MQLQEPNQVLRVCAYVLKPLVRLLLRYGIGYREFNEASKRAFVRVASEHYGIRGRPANLSKIAVLTGLSRKEVRRLRADDAFNCADESGLSPASLVLRGWFSDPRYVLANGEPRTLALDRPEVEPSLTELIRKYAGDLPLGAVITELKRYGSVVETEDGLFRPVGRYFIPANVDGQLLASGAMSINNLISTVARNTDPDNRLSRLFERYAWSDYLDPKAITEFQGLVSENGTEFLERMDHWLRSHEQTGTQDALQGPSGRMKVGVGVYFFSQSEKE